jgi:3-deoxy-D-manno-octulosonic-acid transferase
MPGKRWHPATVDPSEVPADAGRRGQVPRVWFHSASAGEIECTAGILLEVAARWPRVEIVLTVFSQSGSSHLEALAGTLQAAGATLLYCGYCPWEGHWLSALDRFRPDVLVTARYEAWPDLWSSLANLRIPLVIVSAQARTSLRVARRFARLAGADLPNLVFSTISPGAAATLRGLFPAAAVEVTGDPRWDRVLDRSRAAEESSATLLPDLAGWQREWGILGSVWPEDLARFSKTLQELAHRFALCVVPHKVDRHSLAAVKAVLERRGLRSVGLSTPSPLPPGSYVLVDQLGLLMNLYAHAQWAYIGGGFGRGVHSLLEPAAYGLPVACGPQGLAGSEDLGELRASGQLTVVTNHGQLQDWLSSIGDLTRRRSEWLLQAQARQGASHRIVELLAPYLDAPTRELASFPASP